jgi:signal transduction histidine kinase
VNGHVHHHPVASQGGGFLSRLFDASDFTARAVCFNRDPGVIWLHLISDSIIAAAYFSIPITLITLVLKRRDLVYNWMFVLFGGFILLCGTTHVFNVLALTHPMYRLDGVVKALTALFSIGTAAVLWPLIPKILLVPSPSMLREANSRLESDLAMRVEQRTAELARAHQELQELNASLEGRVVQRTQELVDANRELELSHQRLRVSERMAAIGALSAGLGHDMGNLLLPVRARLEAMETRGVPEDLREDVVGIRTSAEYLQRLSRGLRMLSLDPEEGVSESTDLDAWWRDVLPMLDNVLPPSIDLRVQIEPGLPRVQIAAHSLTQAVFNLVQNAGDAMKARAHGTVTVHAARSASRPGLVEITVSDDGPGMTAEVAERCLQPFFTTKTRSISTGLGLALVHAIVQRAGGEIQVRSKPGQGASFTLVLRQSAATKDRPIAALGAALMVRDVRVRGVIHELVRSLGLTPVKDPTQAALWIGDVADARSAEEFVARAPHHRALLLGPGPVVANERITHVAENRPTVLRAAIARAAEQLAVSAPGGA